MKLTVKFALTLALTLILLTSCAQMPFIGASSDYKAMPPTPPSSTQSETEPGAEQAYYLLFEKLWAEDDGLNSDIRYLALDLSKAKLENPDALMALMRDFCDQNGYELITGTIEELTEQGYIEQLYFEDGVVISFADSELTEEKLKTDASKWRSGLGAIGATYTVEKKSGVWTLTGEEGSWIS